MEPAQVLERVDILDYISQFCDLERRGDGEYWGLSPLKDEKTPSFSVNTQEQVFYDFSSGQGGDAIAFTQAYYHCGFQKALEILSKYAGVSETDGAQTVRRLQATNIAKKFRQKREQKRESACEILPENYMERYELRPDKLAVWESEGISFETMDKFQVRYDPFSDRIVYPVRDPEGRIINVSGRTLDLDYKEKRLRKYTYFFPLGSLATIYGLFENRAEIQAKKEVILFEGAKSVLLADSWGIGNTGAILTSHLNKQQFKLLISLGVRVVFALDKEIDIREDKNIMKLLPYVPVEWLRDDTGALSPKDSPVDRGREVFEKLYKERRRLR